MNPFYAEPAGSVLRINVLGVGVAVLNLDTAVELIRNAAHGATTERYVCVTGVHGISEAQRDQTFRKILNEAFLNTPDGMPLSWIGRAAGHPTMDRVYGPDLMLALCAAGRDGSLRHFLCGGGPGVAEALRSSLEQRFPGIVICGCYTPPFRALHPGEKDELERAVAKAQPHLLWVGLSTPKQEKFMANHPLPVPVMIGVGAAFDMLSGRTRQAPYWMQRSGTEWLFRLLQEPRRLWRRYLINNPLFVYRLLLQLAGWRRYPLD